MSPATFATLVRKKTKSDSTSFPNADILLYMNVFKDELAGKLQERRPEIWNMPFTTDLEADQREYAIETDILNRLIYLEIDLDNDGKFVPLRKTQYLHFGEGLTEDNIVARFQNDPKYILRRGAIYVLSKDIIDVTAGLRGVYDIFPANITDITSSVDMAINPSTTSFGVPRTLHEIWCRRVAIAYKDENGIDLNAEEQSYADNLESILDNTAIAVLNESITGLLPTDPDNSDNGYEN